MAVKKELQHAGVEPVFDPESVGASFYRRGEVIAGDLLRRNLDDGEPFLDRDA
jgi:hypothetical protein